MEENYWAEQQRRLGHGFIRLNEQRDENYWTQRSGHEFIRLNENRDENYWTQPHAASMRRSHHAVRMFPN